MKEKFKQAFMETAHVFAKLSTARRLQVGAIIVKDNRIISIGYNGMPSGWNNNCERVVIGPDGATDLVTRPEVLHAEANAITKLARSHESGEGAAIFVTHQPCIDCAKLIYQSGITEVYYANSYRVDDGLEFLKNCGIKTELLELPPKAEVLAAAFNSKGSELPEKCDVCLAAS